MHRLDTIAFAGMEVRQRNIGRFAAIAVDAPVKSPASDRSAIFATIERNSVRNEFESSTTMALIVVSFRVTHILN